MITKRSQASETCADCGMKVGDKKWVVINQWDLEVYSGFVTKFEKVKKEQIKFVLKN